MDVQIVLMTIIAFSAVITVLSFSFNLLLQPVKENQAKIESFLKDFKKEVNEKLDKLLNSQK